MLSHEEGERIANALGQHNIRSSNHTHPLTIVSSQDRKEKA